MGTPKTAAATAPHGLPDWVPQPVQLYLAHTEGGASIRALARAMGAHPSTVLRQVRRTEGLRDDPLADAALLRLGRRWRAHAGPPFAQSPRQELLPMTDGPDADADAKLERQTFRALKALIEPRTILVIADGVEDAVVVHDAGGDRPVRRAVVGRDVAEALVLRGAIEGRQTGRLARYSITAAGRAEIGRLMAEQESLRLARRGKAEDAEADTEGLPGPAGQGARARLRRSAGTDAPLHVLARRNRADGRVWLPPELVAAAMRFRETWEIAQIGGGLTRDWEALVSGRVANGAGGGPQGAPTRRLEAEQALSAAIRALGPDLAETVLMGVCQEQGMEDIEKRLAFPARSGKIVLRIALKMLARHYATTGSQDYDLIY